MALLQVIKKIQLLISAFQKISRIANLKTINIIISMNMVLRVAIVIQNSS